MHTISVNKMNLATQKLKPNKKHYLISVHSVISLNNFFKGRITKN